MFKVINNGKMLERATKYSACVDLFANKDVVIGAGETVKIPLGVKIDLDNFFSQKFHKSQIDFPTFEIDKRIISIQNEDDELNRKYNNRQIRDLITQRNAINDEFLNSHYLQLEPRSSLRAKGLIVGTGIIDLDYKDELILIVHNPIKMSYNQGIPDQYLLNPFSIKKGDKIAQVTMLRHYSNWFGIDTEVKRTGGIGSSGEQ